MNMIKEYMKHGLPNGVMDIDANYEGEKYPEMIRKTEMVIDLTNEVVEWRGRVFKGARPVRNALWLMKKNMIDIPIIPLDQVRINDVAISLGRNAIYNWENAHNNEVFEEAFEKLLMGYSINVTKKGAFTEYRIIGVEPNIVYMKMGNDPVVFYRGLPISVGLLPYKIEPIRDNGKHVHIVGEYIVGDEGKYIITNVGCIINADKDSKEYALLKEYARPGFKVDIDEDITLVRRMEYYTVEVNPLSGEAVILNVFGEPVAKIPEEQAYKIKKDKDVWKMFI